MSESDVKTRPKTKAAPKTAKPPLYKVLLLNDDFTPRAFVVRVLQGVFRMTEGEAQAVMLAAHQQGISVVAVYTREVAETKAEQGTEAGRRQGYPLTFTTERE
ncbi:MAG: ATP-dependent Clp protease adaptor ClpS [Pseudomonadota bacterium]